MVVYEVGVWVFLVQFVYQALDGLLDANVIFVLQVFVGIQQPLDFFEICFRPCCSCGVYDAVFLVLSSVLISIVFVMAGSLL